MNLLVYCSGGFGKEVIDIARRLNKAYLRWDRIAFIDDIRPLEQAKYSAKDPTHYGCPVFPFEAACDHFADYETEAVIANGEPSVRSALLEKLDAVNLRLATLIDPSAVVSESAGVSPTAKPMICLLRPTRPPPLLLITRRSFYPYSAAWVGTGSLTRLLLPEYLQKQRTPCRQRRRARCWSAV